jgi:hypothetical protein
VMMLSPQVTGMILLLLIISDNDHDNGHPRYHDAARIMMFPSVDLARSHVGLRQSDSTLTLYPHRIWEAVAN